MVKLIVGAGAVVFGGMFMIDLVQDVVSSAATFGAGAAAGAIGATALRSRKS